MWLRSALMIFLLAGCEKQSPGDSVRPVKAIQVQESYSAEKVLSFPGTLRALTRADLAFRVDGMVITRDIHAGYIAKKGETLIRLDPREYEIAVAKAQGQLDSIQAQLSFAARDYERMQNIYKRDPGAISQSLLDRKGESFHRLEAELLVAKSDYDKALDNLSYTYLRAPFDGIIAAIYVENHEQVRAKQTVLRLLDTAEREMEINVSEKYMNALLHGKETFIFNVHLDAFPQEVFTAKVKEIGTEASSTTQTYPITLSLQGVPVELSLLAGMSGKAVLQKTKATETALFYVPPSAIFTDNGSATYVWIADEKSQTVHKQQVKLSSKTQGEHVAIIDGVQPGQWIVTAGTSFLSEGQQIKLITEPAP